METSVPENGSFELASGIVVAWIGGKEFYFRARGRHWSLSIGGACPSAEPEWECEVFYGEDEFAAGWMSVDEACAFIVQGTQNYRAERKQP